MADNITLFTDASFSDRDMAAGGAFWAKGGSEGGAKRSGSFPILDAACSGSAEAIASLRSIGFLLEDPQFHAIFSKGPECLLILTTDCQGVKDMLDKRTGAYLRHSVVSTLAEEFWKAQDDLGFRFKCNWVKAHSNGSTARGWVNNWCDEQARRARLKCRERRIDNELREAYRNPEQYKHLMSESQDDLLPWERLV